MKDSERAADLSQEHGLEVGLHLNLTQNFTDRRVHTTLRDHQQATATYLKSRRLNQVIYNPFMRKAFDYLFQAQWDEFARLYGKEPIRLDGHHHMHLCMNMLVGGVLPRGIKIRRNFTFRRDEKDPLNRLYRYLVDRWLLSRFVCTDFFFSILPIEHGRIRRIVSLSKFADVELMVHPGAESQYRYLLSEDWMSFMMSIADIGSGINVAERLDL